MPFLAPNLSFGLSERADGSMKLLYDGIPDAQAIENRRRLFASKGIDVARTVATNSVHKTTVVVVGEKECGTVIPGVDGIVTNVPNVYLTVTSADCVLIYFYDPVRKVVGLAHSGWRGTVQNMAASIVGKMVETYGSRPEDLLARIGPRIQQHHFEVKEDVESQFLKYPECIERKEGRIFIDLGGVIEAQLLAEGLMKENIESDETCTYCEEKRYFSYRRDKPEKLQVMVAWIGMK